MKTRHLTIPITLTACLFWMVLLPSPARALSIGGVVRQPLNLTAEDMMNLGQAELKVTEVRRDGKHEGVFVYRGVPLRTLLTMAAIRKEVAGYSRSVDLVILLHGRDGRVAALSWGEVFYRNGADIIIATSATPMMPHAVTGCGECHGPEIYQPALDQLGRKIAFPKLVISNDFYSDRCLEDITHIEVVEPRRAPATKELKKEGSGFTVVTSSGKVVPVAGIAGLARSSILTKEVGSGRGYHGVKRYEGIPLRDLLDKIEGTEGIDKAVLVTGADGYQSVLSLGEVVLSTLGDRILVADRVQGTAIAGARSPWIVVADDNSSERLVKDITKIEVLALRPSPKVYIVGFGCGDTSLITLEAITCMGRAGAFVAAADFADRFSKYMGDKPVLFDPFTSWEPVYKKNHPELSDDEVKRKTTELRDAEIKGIRDTLAAGKSVAILEPGDPTIYGGWQNWLPQEFEGRTEVVTGINAFSAANAMMGKNIAPNTNSMVLTTPWALKAHEETIKAVAATGDPLAIFMGLKDLESLVPILSKYYPADTPVTIAYKAGISHEKRLVRTRLDQLVPTTSKEKETFLGLVYIGR